jgi:hypothetical protein
MARYKFQVELRRPAYNNGDMNTYEWAGTFNTVVESNNPQLAQMMLENQNGGPERAKVYFQGEE